MIDQKLLAELEDYIHLHLFIPKLMASESYRLEEVLENKSEMELFVKINKQPSFKEVLFRFIDEKELTDAEIYNRANIDRRHFSKIRSTIGYKPKKSTVLALGLALELNLNDMDTLLKAAGYSLSDSDTTDLVIQFCLEKQIYHLYDVNVALDHFSMKAIP